MSYVLLVEDNQTESALVRGLLEKAGLSVQWAHNGREALEAIRRAAPDLVLTDLQMPEINGLELIERIRQEHLFLPVVLMTQYGSEEIAVEALHKGAASYVPKRAIHRALIGVIDDVLAASTARRHQEGLRGCLQQASLQFVLPSGSDLIAPLIGRLQQELVETRLGDELDVIRVGVALHEALTNALQHGSLEVSSALRADDDGPYFKLIQERLKESPYRDRQIFVAATLSTDQAVFVVRDEGPGFDVAAVPDPTEAANLGKPTGRGLFLIRTFMNEVRHNSKGNEITMIKRRQVQPN